MVEWTIDGESSGPLWLQLREWLRVLISTGKLRPGEKLPSIRTLARQAGVSVNTVIRVFQSLERDNLITSQVGRGSFVNARPHSSSPTQRSELRNLISGLIMDARRKGFSASECLAELERIQAAHLEKTLPLVWIECNAFELQVFGEMIARQTGLFVTTLALSELRNNPLSIGRQVTAVLTSIFHVGEVRELLATQKVEVQPLVTNTSPENLRHIRTASKNRYVCFVQRDRQNAKVMLNLLQEICSEAKDIQKYSMNNPARLRYALERAEVIVASNPVYEEVKALAGPERRIFHLIDRVDPFSIQMLQQLYGAGAQRGSQKGQSGHAKTPLRVAL